MRKVFARDSRRQASRQTDRARQPSAPVAHGLSSDLEYAALDSRIAHGKGRFIDGSGQAAPNFINARGLLTGGGSYLKELV